MNAVVLVPDTTHRSYLAVLDKADGVRLLAEALTADVEAILADHTSVVSADAAVSEKKGEGKLSA
jgi:hypothetical protein